MKKKIRVKNFNDKVDEIEINVPNKLHLEIQKNNRVNVFKAKKGKGSYDRNKFKREVKRSV